ncbi:hypothetical protein ABZS52_24740 [Micromonospora profundi]|uniref:hypothetical protein n=1 Tax=Micromonospora profundi TaxID=1420889 RepID=UPI0033A519F3
MTTGSTGTGTDTGPAAGGDRAGGGDLARGVASFDRLLRLFRRLTTPEGSA